MGYPRAVKKKWLFQCRAQLSCISSEPVGKKTELIHKETCYIIPQFLKDSGFLQGDETCVDRRSFLTFPAALPKIRSDEISWNITQSHGDNAVEPSRFSPLNQDSWNNSVVTFLSLIKRDVNNVSWTCRLLPGLHSVENHVSLILLLAKLLER